MSRLLGVLFFVACAQVAAADDVVFRDKTKDLGLKISGSSGCWVDFNNDGYVDLIAGGVWINDGGKRFRKIADVPGACVAADFDNDGFVDVFSTSLKLFRNDGGKQLTEVPLPKLPPCVSLGASWADLNNDGFVDLFVGGYENWGERITYPFLVLINEKGKSFRLTQAPIKYRARGVTACDFDRDGDIDVYVSNYRLQPNLLWLNDGKASLKDVAKDRGVVATTAPFGGGHSIGACWGDFNNDGNIDLFAGNFAHRDSRGNQPQSRFLENLGAAGNFKFKDHGTGGVQYQESYASPSAADFDNDGNLDLFFTTVYGVASFGRRNYPVLFRGTGDFKVKDVTASSGLAKIAPTYQAAWADFDNDGDLDLVSAGKLFVNQQTNTNWIKVKLEGDGKRVNRSAIGAQVRIKIGGKTLTRQVEAGTGQGNQNALTMHFGLGKHADPVSLEIFWPDGHKQTVSAVKPNRLHTVTRR